MKKFLTLVFALLLSISISAQTPLTEAVNFTSTAHNGEEIDLFEILDGGQYALIYFFLSTDYQCRKTTPSLIDAYHMLGCNEGDIYFMEVSPTDFNASYSMGAWLNMFDIPYPTIHKETGGDTGDKIREMFGITRIPTLVLISPDRKIVYQVYNPGTAESMVEYFTTNYDIEENYCGNDDEYSLKFQITNETPAECAVSGYFGEPENVIIPTKDTNSSTGQKTVKLYQKLQNIHLL